MRFSNFLLFILLVILFTGFGVGMYFLWLNLPAESLEFNPYHKNITQEFPTQSSQFYPNMRYKNKEITYFIEPNCSQKKQNDVKNAFMRIQEKTILSFQEQNRNPEIVILCSNVEPTAEQENYFIAGEGGPVQIINATNYAIILAGKVSLYRPDSCEIPQIATHEILHALGFDHNSNTESIMYPETGCEQTIDQEIIDEIARVYSEPSLPDLTIETVEANKTGNYLSFEAVISNQGIESSANSELIVVVNNAEIKKINIGFLEIGVRKILTITNLKIPKNTKEITFVIQTSESELSKENNQADVTIIQDS